MKKKAMIMAVASLGSMALIGTGFAGWVISANTTTSAGGLITAYDVVDHRLSVEGGEWTTANAATGNVVFGKGGTVSAKKPWFNFEGVDPEQLEDTFTFTVKSKDAKDNGTIKVTCDKATDFKVEAKTTTTAETGEVWEASAAWTAAVDAGLVTVPDITFAPENGEYKFDGTTGAVTVSMKVTFKWGAHFEIDGVAKNPYEFYNTVSTDGADDTKKVTLPSGVESWADDAIASLDKLSKIQQNRFTHNIHVDRQ